MHKASSEPRDAQEDVRPLPDCSVIVAATSGHKATVCFFSIIFVTNIQSVELINVYFTSRNLFCYFLQNK